MRSTARSSPSSLTTISRNIASRSIAFEDAFDLGRSLRHHRAGKFDPTSTLTESRLEKTFHARGGVVRIAVSQRPRGIAIQAEGTGASELVDAWVTAFPPDDGYRDFSPDHALIKKLHHALPGLRFPRVPWLFDVAMMCVLEQRVSWKDALRSWRRIVLTFGEKTDLGFAFPPAARIAKLRPYELVPLGVDPKRGRAMIALAHAETWRPFLDATTDRAMIRKRLAAVHGIGPWTTEMILGRGAGDPDALPPGDLHLPHLISWVLAREVHGSDARMMDLMEPFRGQRLRACWLMMQGGLKRARGI